MRYIDFVKNKYVLKLTVIIVFVTSLCSAAFAELEGTKPYPDVTKGPLVEYQTRKHMPDIIHNGWYKSMAGRWYYLDDASRPKIGWHFESADGQWYYFTKPDGEMATGWQTIDDKKYYFSEQIVSTNWEYSNSLATYVAKYEGIKSLGSLYRNEYTPDGHFVNEYGVMVE